MPKCRDRNYHHNLWRSNLMTSLQCLKLGQRKNDSLGCSCMKKHVVFTCSYPDFGVPRYVLKKVAFAMVWKDGQAEIAFKNKNVSQVGQSRKQINPVFSTQQQKVPARFQGCSGFSGRAFSCHQSTATEIPNTFADGN